jgi:hypothetical protein
MASCRRVSIVIIDPFWSLLDIKVWKSEEFEVMDVWASQKRVAFMHTISVCSKRAVRFFMVETMDVEIWGVFD